MNPFYFGSSQRPLFGVYHPPRKSQRRAPGVVLCYPWGQEYMRAHRAFRQLAMLLSKAGCHVLRFDYFGTGDSAGESDEGTVAQWVADVGMAIEELKAMAGVSSVTVVGLRLGGALAALAASGRRDVDLAVLWDPVIDGGAYVAELLGADAAGREVSEPSVRVIGINGFPLTGRLRGELRGLDLRTVPIGTTVRVAIMSSSARELDEALREALKRRQVRAVHQCIPSAGDWGVVDNFGSALLPQEIIQGIVTAVTRETAA